MRNEFKVHRLTEEGLNYAVTMGEKFSDLLDWLETVCQSSAELTICKRKLEEASFYSKKSLAQNEKYQQK